MQAEGPSATAAYIAQTFNGVTIIYVLQIIICLQNQKVTYFAWLYVLTLSNWLSASWHQVPHRSLFDLSSTSQLSGKNLMGMYKLGGYIYQLLINTDM